VFAITYIIFCCWAFWGRGVPSFVARMLDLMPCFLQVHEQLQPRTVVATSLGSSSSGVTADHSLCVAYTEGTKLLLIREIDIGCSWKRFRCSLSQLHAMQGKTRRDTHRYGPCKSTQTTATRFSVYSHEKETKRKEKKRKETSSTLFIFLLSHRYDQIRSVGAISGVQSEF